MTAPAPIQNVWIIQCMQGDYNDQYYVPRDTAKFYLTPDEAIDAYLPYCLANPTRIVSSEVLNGINKLENKEQVWREVIRWKFCRETMTAFQVLDLCAKLSLVRKDIENFEHDDELDYKIVKLSIDAPTPVVNPCIQQAEEMFSDGDMTEEERDKEVEKFTVEWWESW